MALTLEKIGMKKGPPKQDWYFNSNARPWNDGDSLNKSEEPSESQGKPITNRQQTGNKPITKLVTNRQQTGNKPITTLPQKEETDNKPITELVTNRQQTGNKPITNTPFSGLTGLQRSVTTFIYEACKFLQGRITDSLTLEHISFALQTTPGAVKTTISRLVEKGCVVRIEFKNGRGGWSKYRLPESIFHEMLQLETGNKLVTNRQQTGNKLVSELVTSPPSSSSSNLTTDTTTTNQLENKLSPEWEEIDFSSLVEIGFSEAHIRQFVQRGKLTPEQVQDSINAFSFDLRQNQKIKEIKTTPIRYFMKILGNGEIYIPSENYISPQEESIKLYVERKKKLKEASTATEKAAAEFSFEEWLQILPQQQKKELLPGVLKNAGEGFQKESLRAHFDEHVWPKKRLEIAG